MKTIIPEYQLNSKFTINLFGKDVRIVVRQFDKEKGENMCSQCCFGREIFTNHFSGQVTSDGYCCGITVSQSTNCSAKSRSDKNDVVYKRLVKKQPNH